MSTVSQSERRMNNVCQSEQSMRQLNLQKVNNSYDLEWRESESVQPIVQCTVRRFSIVQSKEILE